MLILWINGYTPLINSKLVLHDSDDVIQTKDNLNYSLNFDIPFKQMQIVKKGGNITVGKATKNIDINSKTILSVNEISDPKKTKYDILYKIPDNAKTGKTHSMEGADFALLYKDAATDINGKTYDIKFSFSDMKIKNYKGGAKYFRIFAFNGDYDSEVGSWLCNRAYKDSSLKNEIQVYEIGSGVEYTIKIEIVNNKGETQKGNFLIYFEDIDIDDTKNDNNKKDPNYGDDSEGITFVNNFDLSTVRVSKSSVLYGLITEKKGKEKLERITGSKSVSAEDYKKANFTVIANSGATFKWTRRYFMCYKIR